MPTKSYTQMSPFWYLGIPAAVFGLCYLLWNSDGFVAGQARQLLTPIVDYISRLISGLF